MAKRNFSELLAGAVVLVVAVGFMAYAVANTGHMTLSGYILHAKFDSIDGLNVGSEVHMAGIKVGTITGVRIDPQSYRALVDFTVQNAIRLPKDSAAAINSDGLLGGKYLNLSAGGDEQMLADGGEVTITQSSISIEQLIGKYIFGGANLGGGGQNQGQPQGGTPGGSQGGDAKGGGLPPLK
jgi:phospholipid/cholesterol/gamma-HCH transport system substrate-binding protein